MTSQLLDNGGESAWNFMFIAMPLLPSALLRFTTTVDAVLAGSQEFSWVEVHFFGG